MKFFRPSLFPRLMLLLIAACCLGAFAGLAAAADAPHRWSWQQPHAEVHETGDLSWKPQPMVFEAGESVRYIDYQAGDDANSGLTPEEAWKHHPWDARAAGKAAASRGIHTYVFKRGVVYRGTLVATESGRPGHPIRLTSSDQWGQGEAVISGAEIVRNWKRGADHKDIPDGQEVWFADLDFAPRCVWTVDAEGGIRRIPLARTPNWTVTDEDDVKSQWWHWDYRNERPFNVFINHPRGHKLHLGVDTVNLTQPADYYQDAIVWTEHGWVAGGPYPARVEVVDTKRRGLGFGGRWGGVGDYKIVRYNRYFLEDKPHYLDDPEGEFWFDRKGAGGRLYIRLPGGADPNTVQVEAARHSMLIDSTGLSHVEISGLTFRFTNPYWRLEGVPYHHGPNLDTACIRLLGASTGLVVRNCTFEHVQSAVRASATGLDDVIDRLELSDNLLRFTDRGGFFISDGSPWGELERKNGLLRDVRIMRNYLTQIGLRPTRFDQGFAINIMSPQTLEIAGNVIERCYAAGINVSGGKRGGSLRDVPLSRILIHHNKVVDSLLSTDDFGGIETWQGGPAYVYNNISGNPGGYRHFHKLSDKPGNTRFGHAYYMDGSFKNYFFNNIAWGKSNDPHSPLANRAAFQEIFGFQNAVFNNTVYNFLKGSRRQRAEAGRNKYMGNIFQSISMSVFRHSDKLGAAPNAQDAGQQEDEFNYSTGAYSRNVFFDIGGLIGTFEAEGGDYARLEDFRQAQMRRQALAGDVGLMAQKPPLRNAPKHDFRPAAGSAAIGQGVKVFVPWTLYGEVAEWNFYHAGDDISRIIDEHWYMTPYYVHRQDYRHRPRYPLTVKGADAGSYVHGPLEDWTAGALKLDGRKQYAFAANDLLEKPYEYLVEPFSQSLPTEQRTASGEDLKSPQIHRSSFLIESYLLIESGHSGGVIVEKMDQHAGYSLAVDAGGRAVFSIRGRSEGGTKLAAHVSSAAPVNDGKWHHLIAELDRQNGLLSLYIDGRLDRRETLAGPTGRPEVDGPQKVARWPEDVTLANQADLYVGGTPGGRHLAATLEFMRIAHGTLDDARTTIEELFAWQFDGPFLRDFNGRRPPAGQRRAAGAIGRNN